MIKVAITGLSGVIGQVLAGELSSESQIFDIYHSKKYSGNRKIFKHLKIDLLDKEVLGKVLEDIKPDVIIHMAAITHIDKCEKDKINNKNGIVWKTNVEGTDYIAKYCAKSGAFLIFLSTECVFNGEKEFFDESSVKKPINWYGVTKDEAEEVILRSKSKSAIIRSVVAYHKNDSGKTIYGKILRGLRSGEVTDSVYDQRFTPTNTYDIAKAINIVIDKRLIGIFHISSEESISPYDLAKIIARKNKVSVKLIKRKTLIEYYGSEKASLRLKNSSLRGKNTNKILGFIPNSPKDAI